jgi:hypothetical protein
MNSQSITASLDARRNTIGTFATDGESITEFITRAFGGMQHRKFDLHRIPPVFDKKKNRFRAADISIIGQGSQPELAKEWGIPLPDDYSAFCTHFQEYILMTQSPVHLLHVEDIREIDDALRSAWDVPKNAGRRLFYFAQIIGEPAHFVLRWDEGFKKMDVAVSEDYGVVGEPELLGSAGERFRTDADFASWLTRMIETDGNPLIPGNNSRHLWLKRVS